MVHPFFMKQIYIHKIIEFGLISKTGTILDLGCGIGKDSIFLADKGYDVTAVDIKNQNISHPKITFIQSDILLFDIEKNKYSAIIARNMLPFIKDKEQVKKVLHDMVDGLTHDGVLFFTVFGVKDAWFGKENMSFFTESEIDLVVKELPINIFEKNVMEGFGKTMPGDLKFWHIFSYICTKKNIK